MIATSRLTWTTRISTQSSTISWRTRRIGHIRRFIGASPLGYILPGGRAARMNRNRPANGLESKRRRQGEHMTGGLPGRTPAKVMAECAALFRPTLAGSSPCLSRSFL
jgi:hypothetical protein